MKKIIVILCTCLWLIIGGREALFAQNSLKVMGVKEEENPISIYLKGIREEDITSAEIMIGNTQCEEFEISSIKDNQLPIKTYIVLDNSLSVTKDDWNRARIWIESVINSSSDEDEFALATFGDKLEEFVGFTNDRNKILEALSEIERVKRPTYLTDVLYELIQSEVIMKAKNSTYVRIVVLSDGVDKKNLGITKEELISLLNDVHIPVYTYGMYDRKKSNVDELKQMFAIARSSNGQSAVLTCDEDWQDALNLLQEDYGLLECRIGVLDNMNDGSLKAVKIQLNTTSEAYKINIDNVRMDQIIIKEDTNGTTEKMQVYSTENGIIQQHEKHNLNKNIIIVLITFFSLCGVGTIIFFLIYKKRKNCNLNDMSKEEGGDLLEVIEDNVVCVENNSIAEEQRTMLLSRTDDFDETVCMFEEMKNDCIQMIDQKTGKLLFSGEIYEGKNVTIGRKTDENEICLVDDRFVSGKHCVLYVSNSKYYIKDLQSQNGTMVNLQRIKDTYEIKSGDVFKVGKTEIYFEIL